MPASILPPGDPATAATQPAPAPLPELANGPLRNALDCSDNAIAMTNSDRQVVYVNHGFTRLFGFSMEDIRGKYLSNLLQGPHTQQGLTDAIRNGLRLHGHYHGDALIYSRDGQPRWVSMVVNAADEAVGGPGGSITVLTDITLTKMHEVLQKRVLESMVSETSLPALMAQVCKEVEGIAPEVTASILAVDANGLIHPLAAPGLPPDICAALDGLRIGPKAGSCGTAAYWGLPVVTTDIATDPRWDDYRALFQPTGLKACWSSPIRDHQGLVVGTFAFYFKEPREPNALHQSLVQVCLHLCALAIERDAARQRIHQLAFFDALTGLPNRAMFRSNAERALSQMERDHQSGAVLFVDLDRFKQVNDTQGHAAGDALLREVAQRLGECVRAQDGIGRLSGDEFVLLLSNCSSQQAVQTAQRVLSSITRPVDIQGQVNLPSASIGIAIYPDDGTDIDTLLLHADQAMYQAKSDHLHSLQLFSLEMNRRAQERAAMERALRQALEQRQLTLHYQPQTTADPVLTLHGVEALARWSHPEWGAISPAQFIPLAEETGLIHPLTRWLVDEACTQLTAWRAAGLAVPHVALNLSGRSFHQKGFAQSISATLLQHGLCAQDLLLEITERVVMDGRAVTQENIEQLSQQGFKLSLDDFGTGYSSLSYLHRLPIAELKLDKSFVQDLEHSETARALTISVLSIAKSLHMTVVAEGVETQHQCRWLKDHGCEVMQGYLLGRPMPAEMLASWMPGASTACCA
ncbi:PAS domain S-box-containing protein/diguanylate cyclase (GGDEF)-like protein [Acidovorax sp. 56]|uniref:sensor domain-containing protein n=1 Tax=Acidovorax sp. 56 TaxID=2035205 RepID=UPI000C163650|nr:EAL domain-containing protein [Acidovorax sp. 56]PIF26835.1 PAS domain S-box-containing protein/diguanylate cyclase (GGDEF)-like protein [Acidovorax sp. 56]